MFYRSRGIGVDAFSCSNRGACVGAARALGKELHQGSEAHVATLYGTPFRIVVVSLSEVNDASRLSDREEVERGLCDSGVWPDLNPHMKGTLEILEGILGSSINGRDVFKHFALTRAAKCALVGPADRPPDTCFSNCRQFVIPELDVLQPDLVISQGREARWALEVSKERLPDELIDGLVKRTGASLSPAEQTLKGILREYFSLLRLSRKSAIWLSLVHPSDRFGRWALMQRLRFPPLLGWFARNLVADFSSQ